MSIFLGIDPGMQGAIVALREDGTLASATMQPLAGGEPDAGAMVKLLQSESCGAHQTVRVAAIELVHAGSAMDKRGAVSLCSTAALWRGILAAHQIPILRPSPQTWQKEMLRDRKMTTKLKAKRSKDGAGYHMAPAKDTKAMATAAALELWPELGAQLAVKKNQGIADAALIAEWGRRTILRGGMK
jgi:hypothetical protein